MIGRVNVAGRGEGPAPGPAYSIKKWCATIGLNYENLEDITEADMRKLMSKHTSVDYFLEWYASDNAMLDDFTQSEIAMKWIGQNDYICDKLLAIEDAESRLRASEYWGYILKDKVPIMTANDAPYGNVESSSRFNDSFMPYRAFTQPAKYWASKPTSTADISEWIEYEFSNPICPKKFAFEHRLTSYSTSMFFEIKGTNDKENWDTLYSYNQPTSGSSGSAWIQDNMNNDKYYKYLRVYYYKATDYDTATGYVGYYVAIRSLQFYGRALNVSVPTMTSNTQPYGEAFVVGKYSGFNAYESFNKGGYGCVTTKGVDNAIGYDFGKPICVKYLQIIASSKASSVTPNYLLREFVLEASNDNVTYTPLLASKTKATSETIGVGEIFAFALGNSENYRYYQVKVKTYSSSGNYISFGDLQFFGVDYSDRTERTYLYDHGVEVVPLDVHPKSTGTVQKNADNILLKSDGSDSGVIGATIAIDLTLKKIVRAKIGDYAIKHSSEDLVGVLCCTSGRSANIATNNLGYAWVGTSNLPNNSSFDISQVNENAYVNAYCNVGTSMTITEWWLE